MEIYLTGMIKSKFTLKFSIITLMFLMCLSIFSCSSTADEMEEIEEVEKKDPIPDPDPEEEEEEETDPTIIVSDILTGTSLACNEAGRNASRTEGDIANAANVGTIDDRSCYSNYTEETINGTKWGSYNITFGSNHLDAANTLQPRIERSLARANTTGIGSYVKFTGQVRILESAHTSSSSSTGTYIMQSKGKHTGGGGSADPAICLYLAKPKYGFENGKNVQVSYDIFREQILVRGGSGTGREVVYLTNIKKGKITDIELEVGFRQDPNDASKKIHYSDAVIGGEAFNFVIPEPERGTQSGIRYGAYRVKGGRAQIRWANTTFKKVEKN